MLRQPQSSKMINHAELTLEARPLGQGGFGVVYKGSYRHNNVAVKQLLMDKISAESAQEFEIESQIMAELRSPNIVQFYGYCMSPTYCIVMEYMPNGSLFSVLRSDRPLEWPTRFSIALDTAKGLAFLHQENILHRDIKSLNILLGRNYEAKLTDFGLSRVKTETKSHTMATKTASKDSVGTVAWMAPELFRGMKAVFTPKSDVYSLGVTLWELASRQIPYSNVASPELIPTFVRDGEREEIPVDCPAKLAALIQACWDGAPDKRPTADGIVVQLKETVELAPGVRSAQYQGNFASTASPTSSGPAYQGNFGSEAGPSRPLTFSPMAPRLVSPAVVPPQLAQPMQLPPPPPPLVPSSPIPKPDSQALIAEVVQVLSKANTDQADNVGLTPLWHAAFNGDVKTFQSLLTTGANINWASKDGETPLYVAAKNGHTEIVQALLKANVNVGQTTTKTKGGWAPLHVAAEKGHMEIVQALLKAGAKVDQENVYVDYNDSLGGRTPLHLAVMNGHVEVVQVLLKAGANVGEFTNNGLAPLHLAADKGHIEIMQILLQAGAKVDQSTDGRLNKGTTPLHRAAIWGHTEAIQILLKAGAIVNQVSDGEGTPLYEAADKGHWEAVQVLLKAGANFGGNPSSYPKTTLLYKAAENGHAEVVQALLKEGANVNQTNKYGKTLLYMAADKGRVEVVQALLKAGAKVDQPSSDGITPLYMAAREGHVEVVQALLKAEANRTRKCQGKSPLDIAKQYRRANVVELLEQPEPSRPVFSFLSRR